MVNLTQETADLDTINYDLFIDEHVPYTHIEQFKKVDGKWWILSQSKKYIYISWVLNTIFKFSFQINMKVDHM